MTFEYELIHHRFTPIFAGLGFDQPIGSAAYYVLLIMNFPIKSAPIQKRALELLKTQIKKDQVLSGRDELLEKGFIAEILLTENTDINLAPKAYLPVNPELILVENQEKLRDYFRTDTHLLESAEIKKLCDIYIKKFKKFGIGTETGSFTGIYSLQWLEYTLINNMRENNNLSLMISTPRYSESPLSKYFEGLMSKSLKIKALFDDTNEEILKIAQEAKKKHLNAEIRYTSTQYGTTRRLIFDNMAIDAVRLLDRTGPFYLGTVYLQKEWIEYLRSNFDTIWSKSIEI